MTSATIGIGATAIQTTSNERPHQAACIAPGGFLRAPRGASIGVDGIIVSNHGGRQLDQAPSPLEVLPAINEAVGDKVTLMVDGGIRRGADIVIALCYGARFVMVGRATLYGAVAGGIAGVQKAIGILREEVDLVMGQIGAPAIADLNDSFLLTGHRRS